MNIIYISAEIISTFLEMFCAYYFIALLLRQEHLSRFVCMWMLLHTTIVSSIILFCNTFQLFSLTALFTAPVYLCISTALLFRVNPFLTFSLSGFYCLLVHLIDIFYISLAGIFFRVPDFADIITNGFSPARLFFLLACKLTLLLTCILLQQARSHIPTFQHTPAFWVLLAFFSYAGVFYLIYMTFRTVDINTMFYWILFVLTHAALLSAFFLYLKYRKEQDNQRLVQLRNIHLEENYARINELYQADARTRHDLKNNLLCIRHLISENQNTKALSSLDELLTPLSGYENTAITGESLIDFILNYKIQEAAKHHISVKTDAQFHPDSHIIPKDLCTILFNLLDNAIEACKQLPASTPAKINISMRPIHGFYFIKIENTCAASPFDAKHNLRTSKSDPIHHGLGIDSVRSIVEKYDGILDFSYDEHMFKVIISLFSL